MQKKTISLYTATSIVVANMIGTGVFTSLGFQVTDIHSVFVLMMLWIAGGLIALCGALSYSEIAAMIPESGGEYTYLSKIYHPLAGFLSGFVSALVGFAAPIALAAMALGRYASPMFQIEDPRYLGIGVVTALTLIHAYDVRSGSAFQNISTTMKILIILVFIAAGFLYEGGEKISILPVSSHTSEGWTMIFSPSFAVSLIFVSYAYSGWNASTYLASEIDQPQKNVPRSIIAGTLVVMILYVLLNYIFLHTVPMKDLAGQIEIGFLSAEKIWGMEGGKVMSTLISLLLVSSVSSMIFAGPRITQSMGRDISGLHFLAKVNQKGVPVLSICIQSAITIVMIITSSFEAVITYVGFLLTLFTIMTVLGVFVLRIRKPHIARPFKTPLYPIIPGIFLALNLWILYYAVSMKPYESAAGAITLIAGSIVYFITGKSQQTSL